MTTPEIQSIRTRLKESGDKDLIALESILTDRQVGRLPDVVKRIFREGDMVSVRGQISKISGHSIVVRFDNGGSNFFLSNQLEAV